MEPFYRTSFSKHLHSLARSNYFSRGLDADDRRFLEYVQRHGIANGSLPNTGVVLLEELEFWHFPYSVAPGIERRVGKRPPEEESQEARSLRQARSNAWHARRIIHENEKAIAAAELERERREWEAAKKKRELRRLISDHEWETAAPGDKVFGATVDRHHVPQWKLDEMYAEMEEEKARKGERALAEKKMRSARQEAGRKGLAALKRKRERQRREQVIAEARQTVDRVTRLEREWHEMPNGSRYPADTIKQAIMTLLNTSAPGQVWDVEGMMRAIGGCCDRAFMDQCLNELMASGRLRKVEMKA